MGPGHGQHLIGVIPDSASHTLPRSNTTRQLVDARKSTGRLPSSGVAFNAYGPQYSTELTDAEYQHRVPHPLPPAGNRSATQRLRGAFTEQAVVR